MRLGAEFPNLISAFPESFVEHIGKKTLRALVRSKDTNAPHWLWRRPFGLLASAWPRQTFLCALVSLSSHAEKAHQRSG
jgi:hypothetical protein